GEEELVEARGAAVQDAEAVAPLAHLEEGLDLAVDQELVPDQPVELEEVEAYQPRRRVDQLVREDEGDVEVREARQVEAGQLVAGVELVEDQVEAEQPLVDVRAGVVDAVVVVPERAQ